MFNKVEDSYKDLYVDNTNVNVLSMHESYLFFHSDTLYLNFLHSTEGNTGKENSSSHSIFFFTKVRHLKKLFLL